MKSTMILKALTLSLLIAGASYINPIFAQESSWASIGKGVYYDDLLTAISNVSPASWEVEIEQNTENPGIYRAKDVMRPSSAGGNMPYSFPASLSYTSPAYMYIDATDPDAVYVTDSFSGLKSNGKDYYFSSKVQYYLSADADITQLKRSHPEYFGKLIDGTIIFANGGEVCWRIGSQYKEANLSKAMKLALPDAKDYSLSVTSSLCASDNKVPVTITAGKDVATLKMLFAYGFCEGSDELYEAYDKAYASQLQTVSCGTITVQPTKDGRWSCIIFAYNADGRLVNGYCSAVYGNPDDYDEWIDLGMVTYTDVIVAPLYSSVKSATYDVEIQQNNLNHALYRIVDPYGEAFLSATGKSNTNVHCDHHHYIYIDASDPQRVVMRESPLGLNLGFGDMAIIGLAQYFINYKVDADQITNSNLFGTFKDNRITFPAKCILFTETGYNNGEWVETDPEGQFMIDLSKFSAIDEINDDADDNATPEYFTLQGVKVANPHPGQILIRRNGSKVNKIIY